MDESCYDLTPLKTGHIHYTQLVIEKETEMPSFLLQEFNKTVFTHPEIVAQNIEKISAHLDKNYPTEPRLQFVPTKKEQTHFYVDESDKLFRLIKYERGTENFEKCVSENMAYETGRAFGLFALKLKNLPVDGIKPAIPDFHHLGLRWAAFLKAEKDARKDNQLNVRLQQAEDLTTKARTYAEILQRAQKLLDSGKLPVRLVHADAKVSNLLFKDDKAFMVIDWDTIMPGYFWSDLGDLLRSLTSKAAEDEADLSKVILQPGWQRAIEQGWLEGMGGELQKIELDNLDLAGSYMIYMQALRFLADWLKGDLYYKVNYPLQNLRRAKAQFQLLERFSA